MATSAELSNMGPRALEYYKAALETNGYIHNPNGTVNKANLKGLKPFVSPLPTNPAPKKHAQLETKDTVAFSSEAREAGSRESESVRSFAAAWS